MKWHEAYERRYAALKKAGRPFFPHAVFKDAIVAILILAAWIFLAYAFPPTLEPLADPTDSRYNPRPEWYFLFLFQALKYFPGGLEAVAAVLLPGLAVLALLAVPALDRGPFRHPLDRRGPTGAGLLALAGFLWLTWEGARSPLTNPVEAADPKTAAGRRLFAQLNCAYCHSIGGEGGQVGPKLDAVGSNKSPDWLARHFRDPRSVSPGSAMPKLNLLEEEIDALVSYLGTLAGEEPFTDQAAKLFEENCSACHSISGRGEGTGPDLSAVGAARDKAYLKRYILDPAQLNPQATMPGYRDQLTDTEVEDLARFLSTLGRNVAK